MRLVVLALLGCFVLAAPPAQAQLTPMPPAIGAGEAHLPWVRDEGQMRAEVATRFGDAVELRWDAARRTPSALLGLAIPMDASVSPLARAEAFIATHGDLFGGLAPAMLIDPQTTEMRRGAVVSFGIAYHGTPIEDRRVALRFRADGTLASVQSDAVHMGGFDAAVTFGPDIGPEAARAAASVHFDAAPTGPAHSVLLVSATGVPVRAYRMVIALAPLIGLHRVHIAADNGRVLRLAPLGFDQMIQERIR